VHYIILFIGADDLLHQVVPYHILLSELHHANPFDLPANFQRFDQAGFFPCGKSICVTSPVITALELNPAA